MNLTTYRTTTLLCLVGFLFAGSGANAQDTDASNPDNAQGADTEAQDTNISEDAEGGTAAPVPSDTDAKTVPAEKINGDTDPSAELGDGEQPTETTGDSAAGQELSPNADGGETEGDPVSGEVLDDSLLDASLEELLDTPIEVWTATKTKESIESAPSVMEVITRKDLEKWGYTSVAEALHHTLGFYVIDNHILPNASVRGISGVSGVESGLIKVMINGRSVAFRSTSGNWLGTELIPLSAVERIEVIRGPASALYGADAFLATVNVVLRKPSELNGAVFRGTLGSEMDQFSNFESIYDFDSVYDVSGGFQKGPFGLMVSFSGENSERNGLKLPASSPSPTIPDYNAGKANADDILYNSRVWYAEMSYEKSKGSLTLSGYGSTIDRGGEFAQWAQLSSGVDYLGRQNGTRINLQHHVVSLEGKIYASDKLTLVLNNLFFTGRPLENDRIEVASDLYYIKRDFKYHGFNTVAEAQWKPLERLTLVGGFEMVYDYEHLPVNNRVYKMTGEVIPDESDSQQTQTLLNPAAYLQAHFVAVPDLLQLTGGLRYDYHNIYGSKITGRAGTVFLWTKNFTTKLLYGSAFKAPSPHLLYADPMAPGDVIGNEDLRPQYVHTVELAPALKFAKYLTLHTTVAYNIIIDKAEFVPQGFNRTAANVAEVHSISWETAVDFLYKDIVDAYLGFELQQVIRSLGQEGYQAELVGSENIICPPWIVRGGVSSMLPFLHPVPLRVGLETMIVGPRRASGENIVENGGSYELPVYGLLDASISFPQLALFPLGKTTFSIRAKNLLDAEGPDPGFDGVDYPLLPRRIMAEMVQVF